MKNDTKTAIVVVALILLAFYVVGIIDQDDQQHEEAVSLSTPDAHIVCCAVIDDGCQVWVEYDRCCA